MFLGCGCLTASVFTWFLPSLQVSLLWMFLIRIRVGIMPYWGNPRWSHRSIFNFIAFVKTPFPKKATFTGSKKLIYLLGNKCSPTNNFIKCLFVYLWLCWVFVAAQPTSNCYRLDVSVLLKFICWNLIPIVQLFGGGAIGRWLGREGGALMNGITTL